ncbi:flagellar biosynthesis protein FlhA [Peredibacter starrii]|uniref:Flagellar biosynthesis protein FlhA n=1 Tax=Peredibacter starrii TaxID=28202 RepID=A0AAX4HNF7_9BACT|nr:flagellar biosynthesis protein FlhA [Peredibacter starrii]WPU64697.1 flagellar biosynthesis protein FlhA [Peredibacter starrii]
MDRFLEKLKVFSQNSELAIALGLILILGVMVVPLPPIILDLFLAFSIATSIGILLMSVYARKPLDFSTFPSVLLITTLLRLSLNVASTRNILLHGAADGTKAAGHIIEAFGEFVVGGNYAVGIIIFMILVVINFIVITKGAGRVAEVSARFTLDAMPGKQMAIDADLNAGLIDDKEAKRRRAEVAQEADFYGSMDGASKFVRGDAIAGILITAINIVGGIIVGVAQNDMAFSDAARTFTLLTVGDGLIAQIPALVISTAAGIITTRNSNSEALGKQVNQEFTAHPKAFYITAASIAVFGLIPGFPAFPFLMIGGLIGYAGHKVEKNKEMAKAAEVKAALAPEAKAKAETLESLLPVELVQLEVGYGIVSIVDAEQNGDLLERISHIRKQFALDWGMIIPSVRIKDNLELKPGGYSIKLKGIEIARGELMPDHMMAMDPGTVIEQMDGVETKEPVFGLPAIWITDDRKDEAQYNGYTVVDLSTIVATHLTEVLKANLSEMFGRQELVKILDNFKEDNPKIVSDLVPDIMPLGTVLKVMQALLREGVSVRDLRTILETLAEYGTGTKDSEALTEYVRQALYRTITEKIKGSQGDVPLFTLDRSLEEAVARSIIHTDHGSQLNLDPKVTQTILASLNEKIEEATSQGEKMVILCSPVIRRHFKKLTEKFIPNMIVVSHNELSPEVNIRSLGTVRL